MTKAPSCARELHFRMPSKALGENKAISVNIHRVDHGWGANSHLFGNNIFFSMF
jgi:hypothetical protein